jgi:NAD-dependent dihydropyrimidine dehydrogenase PreA subunit
LPIDPNFQANKFPTTYNTPKMWKNESSTLGIYGTDVAVDFDLCIGDGACIEVCPVNVFDWQGSGTDRKAMPTREGDCIYCFGCEAVCPKFAIRVTKRQV